VTVVDRYFLFREIAAGGMASIHLARLLGPVGFGRTVAVKRLHPQYIREPAFVAMFVDEAHIMTSIRHPNVVPILDVVGAPGHLFLVMEYVHGEPIHRLIAAARAKESAIPPSIVSAIGVNLLEGLHAAHEASGPGGKPLGIVHRDVSPQNVLVGTDGLARVLDFGIAKAASQLQDTTAEGGHKGKVRYMAPEQLDGGAADRRADVWASGVVLWELLARARLFDGESDGDVVKRVTGMPIPKPSTVSTASGAMDDVILTSLARDPGQRYSSARAMALALEAACPPASPREVSEWLERLAGPVLRERQKIVDELEVIAKAGMPSVRTQLAVITERASRHRGPLVPSPPPSSSEDATAVVGGRPTASQPPPAFPPASMEEPADPTPRRFGTLAIVLVLVLAIAGIAVAVFVVTRRAGSGHGENAPLVPSGAETGSALISASLPPLPTSSSSSGGSPTASARKPVRSDHGPDPAGLHLDRRK
jgi:serine/threonine-protein kinase